MYSEVESLQGKSTSQVSLWSEKGKMPHGPPSRACERAGPAAGQLCGPRGLLPSPRGKGGRPTSDEVALAGAQETPTSGSRGGDALGWEALAPHQMSAGWRWDGGAWRWGAGKEQRAEA